MNSLMTTAEDWEDRVGTVLAQLGNLVPRDLAAVLLPGHENRLLVYLDSPLGPELVESVKKSVTEHYRLISEQAVLDEAFTTCFIGPIRPTGTPPAKRPGGEGSLAGGSYLSLPLLSVDEIVGMAHIFCLRPGVYDEEELNLFSLVAAALGSYLAQVGRQQLLEEYDRERDSFVAEMVHELKRPLTSASGFNQMLLRQMSATPERADRDRQLEMLKRVQQQLQRVVQMADSVLDASRVRAGWMTLERQRVDLAALAREAVDAAQATTDNHTITVDVAGDGTVSGDVGRLEQVLRNLLGNAIKFSPEGGPVEVRVTRDERTNEVTVSVRDRSVGISKEQQQHLFERFYRADTATNRRIGGSGLGMYISSEIIRRHGGRIWVDSEPGKGSCFSFSLPAATTGD